jgi:Sigma-70 region 2
MVRCCMKVLPRAARPAGRVTEPLYRSAGACPGVTGAGVTVMAECAWQWWFGLRRAVCRADTGPVIGALFGARLAEAQSGDEAAFACLFRDVQPALLRYLRVIAPEAADDVAGETWLQVVAGLAGFRGGEEAFRAWLFTIARHRAIDAGRSRARRRTIPLPENGAEQLAAPDAATSRWSGLRRTLSWR